MFIHNLVQFNDGKEFYNIGVKTLLEKHDIKYFSTQPDKKAAIVERFYQTLKTTVEVFLCQTNL